MLALTWLQEGPHASKRRLAGDAVRSEADVLSRRADLVRRALASRIKQQYAALYRIDRSIAILDTNRQLLESFLRTARIRYETGEGLLENVLKAQTEVAVLDVQLVRLAQERRSIEAEINRLAGRAAAAPLGVAAVLPPVVAIGDEDTPLLEAEALAQAPEVLALEAEIRRGEARLEASRGQSKLDFMWGGAFGYREDLDPMITGMFGLRLPVYEKRKQAQGIVQSSAELDASRHDAASMRLSVAAQTRDLTAQAARAAATLKLYDDAVIPQARSALDSAAASYGVGRVDFKTLLDDFGALLRYEIDRETQRAEQVAALAGLERLTGRALVPVEGAPHPAEGRP
jgi:outer membrane protein TolC